jgi:hypothetical protein
MGKRPGLGTAAFSAWAALSVDAALFSPACVSTVFARISSPQSISTTLFFIIKASRLYWFFAYSSLASSPSSEGTLSGATIVTRPT